MTRDIANERCAIDKQMIVDIRNLVIALPADNTGAVRLDQLDEHLQLALGQLPGFAPGMGKENVLTLLNALEASLTPAQQALREALIREQAPDGALLKAVSNPPARRHDYFFKRYAHWRRTRLELNENFVNLSLWLDQGKADQRGRFGESERYPSLERLLDEQPDHPALILIGRPGNGKSTLLRHLEQQLCDKAIRAMADDGTQPRPPLLPFYLELNAYPPEDAPAMAPAEWLSRQWTRRCRALPALNTVLREQPVILLLDALNEMRVARDQHDQKRRQWRDYLSTLVEDYPNARVLFSCRTADYGAELSEFDGLSVPQIRIEDLNDRSIRDYLQKQLPDDWQALYEQLTGIDGLELKTPFYLTLAVKQYQTRGGPSKGASDLIAGMIWLALAREGDKASPSPLLAPLFSKRALERAQSGKWRSQPHDFPDRNALLDGLTHIAWNMQMAAGGAAVMTN